jgi:hypothetical protein
MQLCMGGMTHCHMALCKGRARIVCREVAWPRIDPPLQRVNVNDSGMIAHAYEARKAYKHKLKL